MLPKTQVDKSWITQFWFPKTNFISVCKNLLSDCRQPWSGSPSDQFPKVKTVVLVYWVDILPIVDCTLVEQACILKELYKRAVMHSACWQAVSVIRLRTPVPVYFGYFEWKNICSVVHNEIQILWMEFLSRTVVGSVIRKMLQRGKCLQWVISVTQT